MLLLAGCGSGDPGPDPSTSATTTGQPALTAPDPDPTEQAEDAALAAVDAFYDTEEQAGRGGAWSEDLWSEVAAGAALEDRVALGIDYMAAGWIFEGEIGVTDSVIQSVQLEPEPTVAVTSCIDRSTWISPDEATAGSEQAASLVTNTASLIDGAWKVIETAGNGSPCA